MKRLLLAVGLLCIAVPAHSLSRYNTPGLTCERIQTILKTEGAAILRFPSARNAQLILYDIYVANPVFCQSGDIARSATIPSSDNRRCRVRLCQPYTSGGDR